MPYSKQTYSQSITYRDSDLFVNNLLLHMIQAEPTSNQVGTILHKAVVSRHATRSLSSLPSTKDIPALLLTFSWNSSDPWNENHYNRGGMTEGVTRVYTIYLTMKAGEANKELLTMLADTVLDNLTRNAAILDETLPGTPQKTIYYRPTHARIVGEPYITPDYEDPAATNFITALFDIALPLRQKY